MVDVFCCFAHNDSERHEADCGADGADGLQPKCTNAVENDGISGAPNQNELVKSTQYGDGERHMSLVLNPYAIDEIREQYHGDDDEKYDDEEYDEEDDQESFFRSFFKKK